MAPWRHEADSEPVSETTTPRGLGLGLQEKCEEVRSALPQTQTPASERVTGIEPALSAWEPYKIPYLVFLVAGRSGPKWPGVASHGPP